MENKNQSRNIDPQKIRAENLNGRFALSRSNCSSGSIHNNWTNCSWSYLKKYSSLISSRYLVMQYEKLQNQAKSFNLSRKKWQNLLTNLNQLPSQK